MKLTSRPVVAGAVLMATTVYAAANDSTGGWKESETIPPSKTLQWTDCYPGGFQCARLQVPLNYSQPDGDTAVLAITRLPANVSKDSPDYQGPILTNPGGPGGSGVNFVLLEGASYLQNATGPNFDIVSFDPRGVGRSTPSASYYTSAVERVAGLATLMELNSTSDAVAKYWVQSRVNGALAAERNGRVLAHINTENSARDMLAINQAYGRERLKYWGFSYGTVLGATFASLFPDKVDRLILDGVIDVNDDHYAAKWTNGVQDEQKTLLWLFKFCEKAGPENIYTSLKKVPIPAITDVTSGLIDYMTLRLRISSALEKPSGWPLLVAALADLSKGNGTTYLKAYPVANGTAQCELEGKESDTKTFGFSNDAHFAYRCNDGAVVPSSEHEAEKHYRETSTLYPWSSIYASARIACSGWSPSIPKSQFRGPVGGNTSFPILFIGNTADPATSIASARKVAKSFPGSVVLQQDSPGHCTDSLPNTCSVQVIRAYFVNGTLPKEGTICLMDGGSPFDKSSTTGRTQ